MFTLDEVIKMIEDTWVCPSVDEANEYCEMMVARDAALHYLKEYQAILPLMPSLINTAIAVQKKGKTIG